MLSCWVGFAQVNQSYNFTSNAENWTQTGFYHSTSYSCDVGSMRANIYSYSTTATLTSPQIGLSNGNPITMTFDTKAINWSGTNVAAPDDSYTLLVEWGETASGPWHTITTISENESSNECASNSVVFTPTTATLYVRFTATVQGSNDIYVYIDNVALTQEPGNCDPVTDIEVASITSNSVSFSWLQNGGTVTDYDYEIRTSGAPGSGATGLIDSGTTTNLNASSSLLTENTNYTIYIKKNCGSEESVWNAVQIVTPCLAFQTPFFEGFNSDSVTESCWTVIDANGDGDSWDMNYTSGPYEGNQVATLYTDYNNGNNDDWLISPAIEMNGVMRLKFHYKVQSAYEPNDFEILYSTTSNTPSAFTNVALPLTEVSNTTYEEMVVYIPNTGQNTGYIAFRVPPGGLDGWRLYIDNVRIDVAPTCIEVESATLNWVTKNSAELSWSPTVTSPTASYIWEVRTSGDPGSGATGLAQSGTTASGVTTAEVNGLTPGTNYQFYVRANCGDDDLSPWNEFTLTFTTMCNYPDFISIEEDTICGIGSGTFTASSGSGIIQWFTEPNGIPIHEGPTFETPLHTETISYYVKTGIITEGADVIVGEGTTTSSSAGYSPYYHGWGGQKAQYTFRAEELISAGLSAGAINSISFDVTANPFTYNDFTVHMGHTTQNVATSSFDMNLTEVRSAHQHSTVVGINTIVFTTPFVWDGVSNIILQTSYSNNNYGGTSGSVRYHQPGFVSTAYRYSDNVTAAALLANPTASSTNQYRPNVIFNGVGLCTSPAEEVVLTITPSTPIALSAESIVTCQGNFSEVVTITSGQTTYDDYYWIPSTGVTGNAQTGWMFNPQETTTYRLVASNDECSAYTDIVVNVTSLGYDQLEESYVTCEGQTLTLSIYNEPIDVESLPTYVAYNNSFEDNQALNVTVSGTGTSISQNNQVSTVGEHSLLWSYENSAMGYLTLDGTFDGSNSYGVLVEFDHIAILESNSWDWGHVQYSLDGGTTWQNFTQPQYLGEGVGMVAGDAGLKFSRSTYAAWNYITSPANDLWRTETLFLDAATNDLSNLKIRFSLRSDFSGLYEGWFLDNIKVKYVSLPEIVWEPATYLYLDDQLTQPYNGESVGTVYFNHNTPGNFAYTATVSNDMINCTAVIETEVIIPELLFPGLTNMYYCDTVSVDDLEFEAQNGVQYIWYETIAATDPIDSISTSGIYFVQIVTDQCTSSRQPVQVVILTGANVTVATTQYACEGNTITSLVATPSQPEGIVQWFASATSTTPLSPNTQLLNGATYYVNQNLFGCESTRIPVTVQVTETPDPITTDELFVCANTTVANITIDGQSNLHWYTSPTSNVPLAGQAVLTSGTYYVATYVSVCDSQRIPVEVTVVPFLPQIQSSVIDICGNGTVADLEASINGLVEGAQLEWYASSTSTTPLASDEVLYTGTYYAVQRISDCTSTRRAIAVRVNSKSAPIINSQQVCQGTTISEVQITAPSGVTFQWYTSPTATNALAPSTVLTSTTYYVKRVQNGCVSEAASVQVVVNEVPNAPTGEVHQVLEQGSTIENIVVNQQNVVWYITEEDAQNGNNPLEPFMPLVDGQTYYGVIINAAGCASAPLAVTVELFLGLNDLDVASLKVYPNPTSDILNVSYKESIDKLEVYSMLGQIVKTEKGSDREASIDLSGLSAGTYMIKIYVGQHSQLVKVVKK